MKNRFKDLARKWLGFQKATTVQKSACLAVELLEDRLVPAAPPVHFFTVTTILDNNVAHVGFTSLRDAVSAANSDGNPAVVDIIQFAPSLTGKTVKLALGELVIRESVWIQGLGPNALAIDGGAVGGEGGSRIFNLIGGEGTPNHVTFAGLTLQNGHSLASSNPEVDGGGAIGATEFGVNFFGPTLVDSVAVRACVLKNNSTDGVGGAIAVTGGDLTIQDSTFAKNTSGHEGGAILFDDAGNDVHLRMDRTTVAFNTSGSGEQGGGLCIQGGTNTINGCTFNGNIAGGEGGAIANRPTGGEIPVPTNPAFTTIINTTISGNAAGDDDGGGIWTSDSALTLQYDTITQNGATHGEGGGVYAKGSLVNISKTIIEGNRDHTGANDISSGSSSGSLYNVQDSLIQAVAAGTAFGVNQHNIFNVSAQLMPLGYYFNGKVQTQPPKPGSPVLKFAVYDPLHDPAVDANGNSRHTGLYADIGAVETLYVSASRRGT